MAEKRTVSTYHIKTEEWSYEEGIFESVLWKDLQIGDTVYIADAGEGASGPFVVYNPKKRELENRRFFIPRPFIHYPESLIKKVG